jgi:ATP-dependent DNA helicase DinG
MEKKEELVFDPYAIFGKKGLLSRKFLSFEYRQGQVSLAEAIDKAFSNGENLIAEAPCGIGKSFAYLIPAIHYAKAENKKVVVATANITLQEQLCEKDLPFLAKVLPVKFSFSLLKGLNNYLCRDKLCEGAEELKQGELFQGVPLSGLKKEFLRISEWAGKTKIGDVSELPFEPQDVVWSKVSCGSEECTGKECPFHKLCFGLLARKKARESDIIVCNYHILFSHLSIKAETGEDIILPRYSYLVCDEGHEIADIAREFWGLRLSPYSVNRIRKGARLAGYSDLYDKLKEESDLFFDRVKSYAMSDKYHIRLRTPNFVDGQRFLQLLTEYQDVLKKGLKSLQGDESQKEQANALRRYVNLTKSYCFSLRELLCLDNKNAVYWIEFDSRDNPILQSKIIDVSNVLSKYLFSACESVIVTSATLATGKGFDFIKREVGARGCKELIVDSPFDFKRQALLITPSVKSDPNDETFPDEISEIIRSAIESLGGRTMVLFTSYKVLERVAKLLQANCRANLLKQGDLSRKKLLEEFRRDEGTALLATKSFWQGVDIPGEALSCLIIDKIPFEPPDDPIIDAIREKGDDFNEYNLPRAIIGLRQGFGRLIRTKNDKGVVILLDPRLETRGYGKRILASLPLCSRSFDLCDLRFLSARK